MTTPSGPAGPRPSGPSGPSPARMADELQAEADAIVAEIDTNPRIREIADSLPDLPPSAMDKVADIWRRNLHRARHLVRLDRAA